MKISFVAFMLSASLATSVFAEDFSEAQWEQMRDYFSEDWREVNDDGTMIIKEGNRWFMQDDEETSFVDVLCEHRSLQSNGQMIIVPEQTYDTMPPKSMGRLIVDITCN